LRLFAVVARENVIVGEEPKNQQHVPTKKFVLIETVEFARGMRLPEPSLPFSSQCFSPSQLASEPGHLCMLISFLQRSNSGHRVRLGMTDRLLWVWLSGLWTDWRSTLIILKP
jgi:hypothetical protein